MALQVAEIVSWIAERAAVSLGKARVQVDKLKKSVHEEQNLYEAQRGGCYATAHVRR